MRAVAAALVLVLSASIANADYTCEERPELEIVKRARVQQFAKARRLRIAGGVMMAVGLLVTAASAAGAATASSDAGLEAGGTFAGLGALTFIVGIPILLMGDELSDSTKRAATIGVAF
jgi:hypothetical protein